MKKSSMRFSSFFGVRRDAETILDLERGLEVWFLEVSRWEMGAPALSCLGFVEVYSCSSSSDRGPWPPEPPWTSFSMFFAFSSNILGSICWLSSDLLS